MEAQSYTMRDDEIRGPYSAAALVALAKKGELLPTDFLRKKGARDWRLASDFPKLFAPSESPASVPQPSQEPPAVTVSPTPRESPGPSPSTAAGPPPELSQASTGSSSPDPSSLKGLTMALGIDPAEPGQDRLLGTDIGGVTIVRLIAEGGMGRVYEGKQKKPNRTVAVKVMRPGLASPSLLKRFEYEAEVLGRLQHPGIAHIYSVGVHRMGNISVPYFIMEYIADARTLTKYANEMKLPTKQRLELFRSVCDAVAHGHQKGVIHRDLKPSNILVDATGQPKVIDFGVARATDSDMALTTMQTDVGQLIGTLQYMSPEQFKADPNDIDVRSDVYALGVILYELLAGKMPYDVKKKAIHEIARVVKEDYPTPLSSLDRSLKGDVAIIAGKCLEKEKRGRYSDASELSGDIWRHLNGDRITATPPSFIGTVARLVKRHRAMTVAITCIAGCLLFAVVGLSLFAKARHAAASSALLVEQIAEGTPGELNTAGLTTISPELAKVLAEHSLDLSLPGLNTLSPEVAQALAKHTGMTLALDGLTTLSPEVAQALAKHTGMKLALDGLTTLSPEVAEVLAKHSGTLSLNGLATISRETAHELADNNSSLCLDGLTTLSPEVAQVLATHKGDLSLNGLGTLPPDVAQVLAKHNGTLSLNGLARISPEVAEVLIASSPAANPNLNNPTTHSPEGADEVAASEVAELTHLDADNRVSDGFDADVTKPDHRGLVLPDGSAEENADVLDDMPRLSLDWWGVVEVVKTMVIDIGVFLTYILSGIMFLMWVYRVNRNLHAFSGKTMKYSSAWAVWSYFIPFVNIFTPPAVMEEIWAVSHRSRQGSIVPLWWGLVILDWLGTEVFFKALRGAGGSPDLDALTSHHLFLILLAGDAIGIALTAVTLILVSRIAVAYRNTVVENHSGNSAHA